MIGRVRLTADQLGTTRLYDMHHFTDVIVGRGEPGTVVDDDDHLPDGWILVRLDRPDPEPEHVHSDGHLYVPAHPSMVEVAT